MPDVGAAADQAAASVRQREICNKSMGDYHQNLMKEGKKYLGMWREANPFCTETARLKCKPKMGIRHGPMQQAEV